MSAPTSHDPLVVNTRDGVVWQRRAVTADGRGLYAVVGSCSCPEFKMATLAELAAHGIAGSADVLPVPVGPVSQGDPVAAGRGLDLLALMDDRAASKVSPVLAAVLAEAERLRARVAELEVRDAALLTVMERVRGMSSSVTDADGRPTAPGCSVWGLLSDLACVRGLSRAPEHNQWSGEPYPEDTSIVAYRMPVSNNLYCVSCCGTNDRATPLTSDDLPDGGLCVGCDVDVLIEQPATGGA